MPHWYLQKDLKQNERRAVFDTDLGATLARGHERYLEKIDTGLLLC